MYISARYLAHYADWGVVSAVSPDFGYVPFGTLQSYADGPLGNSTGIPYFYISVMSDTYKNIKYNNSASFTVSMAESSMCEDSNLDPEEPTCSRLTLVGKVRVIMKSKCLCLGSSVGCLDLGGCKVPGP